MSQVQRPLSPHLQVYKWQLTSVLSVLHRATGLANGIRHLFWDAGYGYELNTTYASGWTVVAASFVLTLIAWIAAYAVRS
jgi:succinate dehydrogenase / fumarate reductase cytochrome b subunit